MDRPVDGDAARWRLLGPGFIRLAPQPGELPNAAALREVVGRPFDDVWTRDGLDLRSRSIATMSMLLALGSTDELRIHSEAALRIGITAEELVELVMH